MKYGFMLLEISSPARWALPRGGGGGGVPTRREHHGVAEEGVHALVHG